MKKNLTELVFILDRSGSMAGLEKDTIGGYNSFLEKQRAIEGECVITTVLFNHSYTLLHDRIDIRAIRPITGKEYFVGGSTALLDAIGKTIHKIGTVQKNTIDEYRAEKVMFVIITDGAENSSVHYSPSKIREMIGRQKKLYNWEFVFLGANIDAEETAEQFGIDRERAVDYVPDEKGTKLNYQVLSEAVQTFRESGTISSSSFDNIRSDMKRRGKK